MSDEPKPDPYLALGLTKDATSQQIKATYRKLALKYHPDKVTDESLKAAASDNFHKIQTAYETLGDDSKRAKYDANARLEELQRAFQKEKEQSGRYRSGPPPQPMRSDLRPSSYEVPPQATRGSTYPQPRASERYETFRPRTYESEYYDDLPASKPTSRKHSYFEAEPKKYSKSDGEKKKHSSKEAEKERSGRHDKSKRSEKDRKKDRESKKTYVVPDETDSDPELRPRRHDSGREGSKEYSRKKESSESDESADETARKSEQAKLFATSYLRRDLEKEKPRASSIRHGWDHLRGSSYDQPRRSSARSPSRENPQRPDRQRQYSDPTIFRTDLFSSRPPLEKHNTAPPEKFPLDRERERERDREHDRDRRGKSSKAAYGEVPSLKRSETEPFAAPLRRPDLARGESKLRHEFHHGQPTPPVSPPYKSSRRYVIDEDDHTREVSPGTKPTRRARSPSPQPDRERERKSRTSSSRKTRDAIDPQATLPKLRTGGFDTVYGDRMYDSPRSAKPPVSDYPSKAKDDLLFAEVPGSSRRRSPQGEYEVRDDIITYDMSPREGRRSSKTTRPKHLSRSHTQPYGSTSFPRSIFASS